MRRILLTAVLCLATAPAAAAATFGEASYLTIRGEADCTRATGTPGEIAVPVLNGVRFMQATNNGLRFGLEARLGSDFQCGAVATRPNGAGVIAGKSSSGIVVAIREPGGAWGAPQMIEVGNEVGEIRAAVSDRGDAIVTFTEAVTKLRVVRRVPGGAFTSPAPVAANARGFGVYDAGIAANGEAILMWATITSTKAPLRAAVQVAIAPADGAFGAPTHVTDARLYAPPALAVAPDGRALLAVGDGTSMLVSERAPGAAFGPASAVAVASDPFALYTDVALGAGGEAAVAWARGQSGDLQLVTRPAAGAFSAPLTALRDRSVIPAGYDPFYLSETFFGLLLPGGEISFSDSFDELVTLSGDGRAVVAIASGRPLGVGVATVPLAGGPVEAAAFPGAGASAAPLLLADGTPAAAWTEDTREGRFRLHFASAATVEQPDPEAPNLAVGAPLNRVVTEDRPLRLPIYCDGACEVTVSTDFGTSVLRRSRAGRSVLDVDSAYLAAGRRTGPVRLTITFGAPGALHPLTLTPTVRIRRNAGPEPRVTNVRATRRGDRIEVTWRMTGADAAFVSGEDAREWNGDPIVTRVVAGKVKRRDYRVSLPAAGVKYVVLRAPFLFFPGAKVVVRVR